MNCCGWKIEDFQSRIQQKRICYQGLLKRNSSTSASISSEQSEQLATYSTGDKRATGRIKTEKSERQEGRKEEGRKKGRQKKKIPHPSM